MIRSLRLVTSPVVLLVLALSLSAASSACSSSETVAAGSSGSVPTELAPTEPAPTEPAPGAENAQGQPTDGPVTPSATLPLRAATDPQILAELAAAGVDITALPAELGELSTSPAKRKAVMKTFTIALGTTCDGCHAKAGTKIDFAAATPKKNIAKKMWSNLVVGLAKKDGGALYCDSCHQGKMTFLDRADDRALGTWMKENFVTKLARKDGAEHGCPTCHGQPFRGAILAGWSK